MDFGLSDEQLALRDGARELLDGRADSATTRAVVEGGGGWDRDLWAAMVDQGWPVLALAETAGGLGLSWVELAVLAEELGRHVAPAPFVPTVLALDMCAQFGADDLAARLATGGVGCVAWSRRPDAVRAAPVGTGWSLTGRPDPVLFAPSADVAVVAAVDVEGPALFACDLDRSARPPAEPAMDRTRELGWLHLDDVPACRLGGAAAADALVDRGAALVSAELLGAADRVLELAVAYAKDRVQFGRPIGSFQAVKHRCADMLVDVEGMRSTAYWAAWSVAAGTPDASVAASTAKVWCSDAARRVMASGLQVHGGIGFTWEHDLHLYMKRAQLDQLSFGDAAFHRERLTRMLRPRVEAGESVL